MHNKIKYSKYRNRGSNIDNFLSKNNTLETTLAKIEKGQNKIEKYSHSLVEQNLLGKGAFGKVYKISDKFALK